MNNPSSFDHFCIKISKKYVQTFHTRLPETHFLAKRWTFLTFDDFFNVWDDDYHHFSIIWSFELTLFSSFLWIRVALSSKNDYQSKTVNIILEPLQETRINNVSFWLYLWGQKTTWREYFVLWVSEVVRDVRVLRFFFSFLKCMLQTCSQNRKRAVFPNQLFCFFGFVLFWVIFA